MIRKLLIIAAGLLLPLVLGEAYLQVFDPYSFSEKEDWSQYAAKVMDTSTNRLRQGATATYLGKSTTISSQGWRSPEFEPKKPPGVYRILLLGGSVPYGWGVADGDEFPRVLERELNARRFAGDKRVEVINTGVPGWKLPEVGVLLPKALAWQPDMVMLVLVSTDVPRAPKASRSFFLSDSIRACRLLRAVENRYVFGTPGWGGRPYDDYDRLPAEGLERVAQDALTLLVAACAANSAEPVIIDTLNSDIIRKRCADLALHRVEAYTPWALRRSWHVGVSDPHSNAVGHRYYADLILKALPNR